MPLRVYILFAYAVSACLLSTAQAQFIQQGGKLVGTGVADFAYQGNSVAVSADGNTAIVGGPFDNGGVGAAWVFTRTGGVWNQQGSKLVGTGVVGYTEQGASVALSADGNTAIVGGPFDNGYAGAAWVFTRTGGVWSQQGDKLVGTGAAGSAYQGGSVALSADGNTAIVGGLDDDSGVGAVWLYARSGGVWSQHGEKLVGTGAIGSSDQGASVALSADGNTAIVGGPVDNGAAGAAWVYTQSGGVWSQQGDKLVGSGAVGSARQGASVALSADGNTGIVGGPWDSSFHGAAWVYTRSGGGWSQEGGKLVGTGYVVAGQGSSVALSAHGNTAIVGGPGANRTGATWVYKRTDGLWGQLGDKLVGTGAVGVGGSAQGYSVTLSADGNTAIVGGNNDALAYGAAWVFVSPPFINTGGVLNGASFLPGIAPGTWISIFGSNLSGTTRSWNGSDFAGVSLPTELDGVSVTVDGWPAYVSYISSTQLNVLAPDGATQGPVAVQVTNNQGKSNAVNADKSSYSPALFTSGQYVAGVGSVKPGDIIVLFGTGFGATSPWSPIGQIVSPSPLASAVTVRIGGVVATTQFTGIVGAGLYQFNVVVPNVSNGDNAVVMEIGGSSTQPNAFLAVQR